MSQVLEIADDFDAAVVRIRQAKTEPLQRRAIREALGHLYTLREFRAGQQNKRRKIAEPLYLRQADKDPDGRITEGLVFIRGQLVHQVTKLVGVKTTSALSARVTATFGVLAWLRLEEMDLNSSIGDQTEYYKMFVAGRPVIDTLDAARRFLVESPLPPTITQ